MCRTTLYFPPLKPCRSIVVKLQAAFEQASWQSAGRCAYDSIHGLVLVCALITRQAGRQTGRCRVRALLRQAACRKPAPRQPRRRNARPRPPHLLLPLRHEHWPTVDHLFVSGHRLPSCSLPGSQSLATPVARISSRVARQPLPIVLNTTIPAHMGVTVGQRRPGRGAASSNRSMTRPTAPLVACLALAACLCLPETAAFWPGGSGGAAAWCAAVGGGANGDAAPGARCAFSSSSRPFAGKGSTPPRARRRPVAHHNTPQHTTQKGGLISKVAAPLPKGCVQLGGRGVRERE